MPQKTPAQALIETLNPPHQRAIQLVALALDCFNSAEGIGLFSGAARYQVLAGRVEICAAQARELPQFWALLLRRMQWPVPPRSADPLIVAALSAENPRAVLHVLATETASVVTLARMVHDAAKAERKALAAESRKAADGVPFDDDLALINDSLGALYG